MEEIMKRITVNHKIFAGKPIIRGMRISVELILSLLSQGRISLNVVGLYNPLKLKGVFGKQECIMNIHNLNPRYVKCLAVG